MFVMTVKEIRIKGTRDINVWPGKIRDSIFSICIRSRRVQG